LVYLLPVICAVSGAWLAGSAGDTGSILGALGGLLAGGMMVNFHSKKTRNDLRTNPVLFDSYCEKQNLDFL